MSDKDNHKTLSSGDAFASVAFWQLMIFVLLLCFTWASELLDLPAAMGAKPTLFNLQRVCLLSAAIITAGIVAVGHTYETQKNVIRRMLMTCVYCHRIMHEDGSWEHVEEYFVRNYPMELARGACPECEAMLKAVGETKQS